jgi:PAS domain S-box-containing protein
MTDRQANDPEGAWPGAGGPTTQLLDEQPTRSLLLAALAASETAAWHTDLVTRERWWSDHMFALHGLSASQPVPADYLDLVLPEDRGVVESAFRESVEKGSHRVEYRVRWPDGSVHWIEGRGRTRREAGRPVEISGVCQLVDARRREEADLAFLAQASLEFARSIDDEETLRRIAAMAVPHFADWCAVDLLDELGRLRRVAVAHVDPAKVELARQLYRQYPPQRDAGHGLWQVLESGRPELLAEISDEMLARGAVDAQHLAILRSLGLRSYVGVPITTREGTLGVISFVSAESGRVYGPRDLDVATELASRAALAIRNATLFQQLRRSQRRQDFLLRLTDVMRAPATTTEVLQNVSEMLGRHFEADRVGYGHVDEHLDRLDFEVCWTNGRVPALRGRFPASDFGAQVIERLRGGRSVVIANVRSHALTRDDAAQRTSQDVDTRAILVVPLFKAGRLRTIVYLNQREQRHWTVEEVELMEEVAERTRELIERGRTEDALRASESRWRGLFERMNEGFFVAEAIRDEAGRMVDFWFLQANPAFEKLTGVPTASAIGRTVTEAIPGVPQALIDTYARVVDTGEAAEFEVHIPALNDRWYEARAMRLAPEQFSALFLDITERRRVQDELVQREAQLREADARKNEFLATLAHELRNPLAPLRNGLMILRHADGTDASAVRARELMERQLTHLVRLVDDLLDVARVSQGKVTLKKLPTSLQAVVETALETSRPLIDAAGHRLTLDLPAEPLLLDVDPTRIAQVLANLLNNAAKYTPAGGHVRLRARAVDAQWLRIDVEDDGLGIPADMLDRVFELFTQVGGVLERAQGGLGIGLSLARRLVELHGGRILAHSAGEGRGSTFVVELPLGPAPVAAEVAPPQAAPAAPLPRRRVLVVDDNVDAAESLQMLLALGGVDARLAHNGAEALAVAEAWRPDLVFLDIGLPDMSGHDVARSLRARPGGAEPVLVALTGWGSQRDQELAREAGMDLHLTKPVGPDDLERALALRPHTLLDPVF